ncbi:hypothetical protein O5264_29480, partial [Escherichia coli]|nr:hypothetical protein [Escherichia coli]
IQLAADIARRANDLESCLREMEGLVPAQRRRDNAYFLAGIARKQGRQQINSTTGKSSPAVGRTVYAGLANLASGAIRGW